MGGRVHPCHDPPMPHPSPPSTPCPSARPLPFATADPWCCSCHAPSRASSCLPCRGSRTTSPFHCFCHLWHGDSPPPLTLGGGPGHRRWCWKEAVHRRRPPPTQAEGGGTVWRWSQDHLLIPADPPRLGTRNWACVRKERGGCHLASFLRTGISTGQWHRRITLSCSPPPLSSTLALKRLLLLI